MNAMYSCRTIWPGLSRLTLSLPEKKSGSYSCYHIMAGRILIYLHERRKTRSRKKKKGTQYDDDSCGK